MGNISEEILKSIEVIVKAVAKKLDFDRTYTGIISAVNKDGYIVKYNGKEISIREDNTDVFKVGEQVRFCVPCGNKRMAFLIYNLANQSNDTNDGSSGSEDNKEEIVSDKLIATYLQVNSQENEEEEMYLMNNRMTIKESNGSHTRIRLTDGKCYLQYYSDDSTYVGQVLLGEVEH